MNINTDKTASEQNPEPVYGPSGWRCPVCGRGNAPFVSQCPCAGNGYPPYIPQTPWYPPYPSFPYWGTPITTCCSGHGTMQG